MTCNMGIAFMERAGRRACAKSLSGAQHVRRVQLRPNKKKNVYARVCVCVCIFASGLVRGAGNGQFYELIRGPVVTSKTHGSAERSTSRVNSGAGEELTSGPVNMVEKGPKFTGPLANSWPARLLTLEFARFSLSYQVPKKCPNHFFCSRIYVCVHSTFEFGPPNKRGSRTSPSTELYQKNAPPPAHLLTLPFGGIKKSGVK